VNDHVDVAVAARAWVHLGQGDGDARGVPHGRSCHELGDLDRLVDPGLRYIGFGPVFGTSSKATGYAPRGVALLAEVVRRSPVPVVAIGGIHGANVEAVRQAGAWAWAVIGGVWGRPDPEAEILALTRERRRS
jgi:thiamine-phosphate pyrophosphorylase